MGWYEQGEKDALQRDWEAEQVAAEEAADIAAAKAYRESHKAQQPAFIRSARTRSEPIMRAPHATLDGVTTLCGQKVDMTDGRFSQVLVSLRCSYCHRDAAALDIP